MGLLPIGAGLSAAMILPNVPPEGVVTAIAQRLLSPTLLMIFLLAIVSAVLSTIVSAVMAPAAIVAHNLIEPFRMKRYGPATSKNSLSLQRWCVVGVTVASVILALSGTTAYELVQRSYAMSLVGLFIPFIIGLYSKSAGAGAAIAAILAGSGAWGMHLLLGWEQFLHPVLGPILPIPHELADTLVSGLAFVLFWSTSNSKTSLAG
jgi:Na+/proline symporter